MKTIQVASAEGPTLNWLVAKCEGKKLKVYVDALLDGDFKEGCWVSGYYPDPNRWVKLGSEGHLHKIGCFSTDWAQGGPIIEREGINIEHERNSYGEVVQIWASLPPETGFQWFGHTPLIAAMRCYVASKLGETAEVPEELT